LRSKQKGWNVIVRKSRIAVAVLLAVLFAIAGQTTATAAPRSAEVAIDVRATAPGQSVWIPVYDYLGFYAGEVGMVSHVGGYWDLYVCDDYPDGVQVAARIDPGDGRILPYYDSDTNGATCYNRDIWYDVRKFRGAWGSIGTEWKAPPPL
jgi:hypothetical protein